MKKPIIGSVWFVPCLKQNFSKHFQDWLSTPGSFASGVTCCRVERCLCAPVHLTMEDDALTPEESQATQKNPAIHNSRNISSFSQYPFGKGKDNESIKVLKDRDVIRMQCVVRCDSKTCTNSNQCFIKLKEFLIADHPEGDGLQLVEDMIFRSRNLHFNASRNDRLDLISHDIVLNNGARLAAATSYADGSLRWNQ